MDGSLIGGIVSQASALDGLAVVVAGLVAWFLIQHTRACSLSRKELYAAINGNTDALRGLGERIARLEGKIETKQHFMEAVREIRTG